MKQSYWQTHSNVADVDGRGDDDIQKLVTMQYTSTMGLQNDNNNIQVFNKTIHTHTSKWATIFSLMH